MWWRVRVDHAAGDMNPPAPYGTDSPTFLTRRPPDPAADDAARRAVLPVEAARSLGSLAE